MEPENNSNENKIVLIGADGVKKDYDPNQRRHHHHRSKESSHDKHEHHSHKTLSQRILLKVLPLALFFIAVGIISHLLINYVVLESPIVSAFISDISSEGGEGLNNDIEIIDIDENVKELRKEDIPTLYWGDRWATLSIPAHGVEDKAVYVGDSNSILNQMVIGKFFGSVFPGQKGKTVLDGHVSAAFNCLEDMQVGEQIILDTVYGQYIYEVQDIIIFAPNELSMVMQEEGLEEDILFCYTCYPRNAAYRSKRIGVRCIRVSGIPWSEEV